MRIIGLTGSIAMGKSTAGKMLTYMGIPVHDADAAVHRLYAKGGAAVAQIRDLVPTAVKNGAVDREALAKVVLADRARLQKLEALVHPLVQADSRKFIRDAQRSGRKTVALDIPLLFETNSESRVDKIFVVSAPTFLQRQRALARSNMTKEKLAKIIAQQMPDAEKRRLADFVIPTGLGKAVTYRALASAVRSIN